MKENPRFRRICNDITGRFYWSIPSSLMGGRTLTHHLGNDALRFRHVDRLGYVGVHAGFQAFLHVLLEGVARHRDDGDGCGVGAVESAYGLVPCMRGPRAREPAQGPVADAPGSSPRRRCPRTRPCTSGQCPARHAGTSQRREPTCVCRPYAARSS